RDGPGIRRTRGQDAPDESGHDLARGLPDGVRDRFELGQLVVGQVEPGEARGASAEPGGHAASGHAASAWRAAALRRLALAALNDIRAMWALRFASAAFRRASGDMSPSGSTRSSQ